MSVPVLLFVSIPAAAIRNNEESRYVPPPPPLSIPPCQRRGGWRGYDPPFFSCSINFKRRVKEDGFFFFFSPFFLGTRAASFRWPVRGEKEQIFFFFFSFLSLLFLQISAPADEGASPPPLLLFPLAVKGVQGRGNGSSFFFSFSPTRSPLIRCSVNSPSPLSSAPRDGALPPPGVLESKKLPSPFQ